MIESTSIGQSLPLIELSVSHIWDGWSREAESWTVLDADTSSRAYELWNFAAELNDQAVDDVARGTVAQKLWHAVDQRIRTLQKIYRLNTVKSILGSPRISSLDVLNDLGIIRPLVLKNLKDVRNRVEHQDRGAPDALECSNLVDTVWYFLRSTDYLVVRKLTSYTRESGTAVEGLPDRQAFVSIQVSDDWGMRLSGWFRRECFVTDSRDVEIGLVVKPDRQPDHHGSNQVFLSGSVAPTSAHFPHLIRDYFGAELPLGAIGSQRRHFLNGRATQRTSE